MAFENVVILGYNAVQEIFGDEDPMGKNIYISVAVSGRSVKKIFKAVGILKKLGNKLMYRPVD